MGCCSLDGQKCMIAPTAIANSASAVKRFMASRSE
jgi:hypothetical protein